MTELEKAIKRELLDEFVGTMDHTAAFNEVYNNYLPNTKPVEEVYVQMIRDEEFDAIETEIGNFINKLIEEKTQG